MQRSAVMYFCLKQNANWETQSYLVRLKPVRVQVCGNLPTALYSHPIISIVHCLVSGVYLEVAGVDPGAGDAIDHLVQCCLILLQVVGLLLVHNVIDDLLPHLQPSAHVLLQDLGQAVLHAWLHHPGL